MLTELGAAAADCLAAVARGVYEAKALPDGRSKFDSH
jgi:hypothetical protein